MRTLPALLCSGLLALPLPQSSDSVRGVRVDRPLDGGAWLPAGSVGGRPIDALTPGWPWYRLIVEADLGDEAQRATVAELIDRSGKLPERVSVLVVDLGEREAADLDWLLWTSGLHETAAAFATELEAGATDGEPGWTLSSHMPAVGGQSIIGGRQLPTPGGALDDAKDILDRVDEALDEDERFCSQVLSADVVELAVDLNFEALADWEDKVNRSSSPSNPDVFGADAAAVIAMAGFRTARGHLAAEVELCLAMGQPGAASAAFERLEAAFGYESNFEASAEELFDLGLDKGALKSDKSLRKVLGEELGDRPDRVRTRLKSFIKKRNPEAVEARAIHYLALLDRFAAPDEE